MEAAVEIWAIVRTEMRDRVVRMLQEAGVPRLTVTRVRAIGAGAAPDTARYDTAEGSGYAEKPWCSSFAAVSAAPCMPS